MEGWGQTLDARSAGLLKGIYVEPEYPRLSRLRGEQGSILIGIQVEKGVLSEASTVVSSGFPRLDDAALEAVRLWVFDDSVSLRFVQRITFRLTG